MLRFLKPQTRENVRENAEEETENEAWSFYTPTKSVRINSTQNNETNVSRNNKFSYFETIFHVIGVSCDTHGHQSSDGVATEFVYLSHALWGL